MTTKGTTSVTRIVSKLGLASRLFHRSILLKPGKRSRWSKASRFTKSVVSIGSAETNDLVLRDSSVSRHHARIEVHDGLLRITDLASTNGTFVSDVRVLQSFLPERTNLLFGDCSVAFRIGDERDEVALSTQESFGEFIGRSVVVRRLFEQLAKLAPSEATVLLEGESGTGKELLARAIHDKSPHNEAPFITVDCGALPPGLIESELFGHSRGAFTGAIHDRAGAFELAQGGTLFLDEVGELDLALQPKLLRALESRTIRRVGASEDVDLDVRIVAATNRDLHQQMATGEFREDLYYRLAVAHLRIPPLRERREDIPMLARHLLDAMHDAAPEMQSFSMTDEMASSLQSRVWRGNVRELRNVLERAFITSELIPAVDTPTAFSPLPEVPLTLAYAQAREQITTRFEQTYLRDALERYQGNVAKTARECGMDRATLFRLIKKHGLKRPS